MDRVFVKIASYRDKELPLTIKSAIAKAKYPERLTFGICWQYDELGYLDLDPYLDHPQFRVMQTHYQNSKGCCWARHQSDLLYEGEEYTLQIDAHTRFAQDWDQRFIEMLEGLDSNKPLLTTYPAPFEYLKGVEHLYTDRGMQKLVLKRLRKDLTTILKTEQVPDTSVPVASDFIAAGQIFTYGRFCEEVLYDSQLYFCGEEISLSARAYTHGYDFFCPNEDLLWHLYNHSMPVHSGDHKNTQHQMAISRLNTLLVGDSNELGRFGLGNVRTLQEYQSLANLDFSSKTRPQA